MPYIDQRDIDEMKETLQAFEPTKNRRAINRARSTAIRDTKSQTGKSAARALALRSKAASPKSVKDSITSKNKTSGGNVTIAAKPILGHLFENELTGPRPTRGSAPVGVRFFQDSTIKTRPGYFRTKRQKYKNSPIKKRKGRSRYPLQSLYGPTVFGVYDSGVKGQKRQDEITEFGAVQYQTQLSRQIDLVLRDL